MNGTRLVRFVVAFAILTFSALLTACSSEQGRCLTENTGTFTFKSCYYLTVTGIDVDGEMVVRHLARGSTSDPVQVIANVNHTVTWHFSDNSYASYPNKKVGRCSNLNLTLMCSN